MDLIYAISDFGDPAFASATVAVLFVLTGIKVPKAILIIIAGFGGTLISRGPVVFARLPDFSSESLTFAFIHFAVYLPAAFVAAWLIVSFVNRALARRVETFE